MQAIVIKYIQLFCVAVLFDKVSCDEMMLQDYQGDLLFYQTTSCAASCLKNSNKKLQECYENVCGTRRFNGTEPQRSNATNFKIKLLCRDDTNLTIEIVDDDDDVGNGNQSGHLKYSQKKIVRGNLYMVKIEGGNKLSKKTFYITESPMLQIHNLTSNTTYNITANIMYSNYTYTNAVRLDLVKTLSEGYEPKNITITNSTFLISETSNQTLDLFVTWNPAADRTCYYYIHVIDKKGRTIDVPKRHIDKPELLYYYPIRNLSFGTKMEIGIQPLSSAPYKYGSNKWMNVTAPTCNEWYTNDLTFENCAPSMPTNLNATATVSALHLYRMNVHWDKPEKRPQSYSVVITDFNRTYQRDVSGGNTFEIFEDVQLFKDNFEVRLTAISAGGSITKIAKLSLHDALIKATENGNTLRIMLYIGTTIIAVILVGVLIATFIHHKARLARRQYMKKVFEVIRLQELDKQCPEEMKNEDKRILLQEEIETSFLNDGLEIDEDDIDILDVIGEGAFGFVSRGVLLPTGKEVAIKRLKDVATLDIMRNFCREVEVMRSVDKHPNILGIVGHCMKNIEQMMILTEYCSRGSLRDFLKNYWQGLMKCSLPKPPTIAEDCSFQKPIESDFNFGSSIPDKKLIEQKTIHTVDDSFPVCIKNLIINKLYGECSDNIDSKPFYPHDCGNTCKSYVDIIEDKVKVSVKDCDCRENQKNKLLNYLDPPNTIVENRGYGTESEINKLPNISERVLTQRDLLSFALQIATGMEFLSFNKVVHRDLAARNICVCFDYTVKIADFGLSRDIYEENVYKKETDGKLPIKWLALESMTYQIYNSQSDVWSYGILLYEIVTLGSTPYPGILAGNLLKLLMSGYRMEKPPNCDDNVYELMFSCWRAMPSERPTFTEIKLKLERLLTELADNQPMHNNMFENNSRSINSSGSYLTPL